MTKQNELKSLAALFLKLGIIGFGGPAVHIAMMEEEVVRKRKWMTAQHFLDLVGATNLIPGPNSTEMAMHIGQERAGYKGLIVAGSCFIIPPVVITAVFAWAYKVYGQLPEVYPYIYGIKPAIIAVVVVLMFNLARKAFKTITLFLLGIVAFVAVLFGLNEIMVLFVTGLTGIALYLLQNKTTVNGFLPFVLLQALPPLHQLSDQRIFLIFLKVGAILYGSGYVLFAFLDAELVSKGWLSKQQLIDAIAVGQFTPGPVFSSATFIGWQIGGAGGAVAATIGIFLPSFMFVALLNPLVKRLRKSAVMSAFLDTVNAASISIILSVIVEMATISLLDWRSIVITIAGFAVSFHFKKVNTAFVILGGAILGYILYLI